jgi:hypothetical protein
MTGKPELDPKRLMGRQSPMVVVSSLGHTAQVRALILCGGSYLATALPLHPFEIRILGDLIGPLTLSPATPIVIENRRDEG